MKLIVVNKGDPLIFERFVDRVQMRSIHQLKIVENFREFLGDSVNGDIKIDGQSLKEFMSVVSKRLNILTPKPEVLEKYEALREAYENYKMLEKICLDDGKVHEET